MIEVRNLEKSFGDLHVLRGINETVNDGEVVCVIGTFGIGQEHVPPLSQPSGGAYRGRCDPGRREDKR